MKRYVAEFIGTYGLVFCGTGAIVVNEQYNGVIGHAGIAITFGLIVLAMIYTFGPTSGAHLNPAVSLAFAVAKRFPLKEVLPYALFQIGGAVAASLTLRVLFPENEFLGSTLPSGIAFQSFIFEFILTFFLMLVIIHVSQGSKEIGVLAGIAIGMTVLLEAMFAGPVCGASMNPARSLAPALVSGHLEHVWIYIAAPVAGAVSAIFVWRFLHPQEK